MGNASLKAYQEATIDGEAYAYKFTFKNVVRNPAYVTDIKLLIKYLPKYLSLSQTQDLQKFLNGSLLERP